jgi:amidophosphoribosyltransferase
MCAIVGVFGVRKAIELAVVGAHQLQHRARTYAGATSSDGHNIYRQAGKGLARTVFDQEKLNYLHGMHAVVHLRYPTVKGTTDRDNIQPVEGIYGGKKFALAHNGNITNVEELRKLLPQPFKMATVLDTEYIVRLIEHVQTGNFVEDLARVAGILKGSFSLVILLPECMIALRDKSGNRPLSIAKLKGGWAVSSENCAFPSMGATDTREVEPGTMCVLDFEGMQTIRFAEAQEKRCIFELLYNASVTSTVFGLGVHRFREEVGNKLEHLFGVPHSTDVVVASVPDSGNAYAMGFARSGRSGAWMPAAIIRNHYVGRTFNAATQGSRDEEVSRKFTFSEDEIRGKVVAVLDDSIVRGTTLPKIVSMLWQLGAKEIHVRIGTPPIAYLCRYGIYMDEDETELIAALHSPQELARLFGATSLEYLPLETLKELLPDPEHYCFACMDGEFW